ncbi:hypothetical protein EBU94_08830 [bacterium]|nr:hypothetical protein [bacterium]
MTTKDEKTEGIIYFDELDSQDLFGLNKGEDNDLTGKIEIKDPDKPEDTNVSEKQEEDDILLSGTNPGREKQPGEEKPIVNPIQDVLKTRRKKYLLTM